MSTNSHDATEHEATSAMSGSSAPDKGLRRHIATTLVGVALVSVLLLSTVNYVFARFLLEDSVESQLAAVRDTRVQALEISAERLQSQLAGLAINPSVADALVDFSTEFERLDEDISDDELANLIGLYDAEVVPPFAAAGVEIDPADLLPGSAAGRYLQHHYISENPGAFEERAELDDAGDGSGYSDAHASHHPLLRTLMTNIGMSDLLLVDVDTGAVVYSTQKRIDLGTTVTDAAVVSNGLGVVLDKLTSVAVGDAVVSDTFFYVPSRGEPMLFLAAVVRSGADVVGAVVTQLPVQALTAIMTAEGDWQQLGLGETGESYIVGADRTLRTDTRAWLTDPDDYLSRHADRYEQDSADLIEIIGSPVLIQTVDNAAVSAGLDGDDFTGTVDNYLGSQTLAASGLADVDGVNWAVVVEVETSETNSAVNELLRRFIVLLAILLPGIAVIGILLARSLTKPAESLVASAARIADGDLDTEVEDLGRNELGDLGRQLEGVVRQLESREQAIIDEERQIDDMLRALLPDRLVDRFRDGERQISDLADTATVISITIDDVSRVALADSDLALEMADRINEEALALMERFGVERIRRSSSSQLYLTGLDQVDACVDDAAAFTFAAMQVVAAIGDEFGHVLSARAGIAAGDVATGILGSSQLSFGVWGGPTGVATTLAAIAEPGQVLADRSVVDELGSGWLSEPLDTPSSNEAHVLHAPSATTTTPEVEF